MMKLYKLLNIPDIEYRSICEKIGREPNDVEVYLFSAMWSEHCSYKHSIKYISKLPSSGSAYAGENAGGVPLGNSIIFFKVESHNHPSAVEPIQGAATGVGGIIRDILALGARPIALLDSLHFGNLENNKYLFNGVIEGISSYGNSIGVPTVAGEVNFINCYDKSPLVNVMAVGIAHRDEIKTSKAVADNKVVLVGAHTGRDGIHGASFASNNLSENVLADRPSVQIGDPFMKKNLIEATLQIAVLDSVLAIQDCGAAGILSSTSEMAYKGECSIKLELDKVHLREERMQPWEIMLSESQERMLFIVKENGIDEIATIAKKYDIPYSVIGHTSKGSDYILSWYGKEVANIQVDSLCDGVRYELTNDLPAYITDLSNKHLDEHLSTEEAIYKLTKEPNFAKKDFIYSQYDYMVGNRTVQKPDESSAAGLWIYEENKTLGLTLTSRAREVFLSPYEGAKNTVWEAFRNLISSGFEPLGVTNCLNYGNPENDEIAYQFRQSVQGIADACFDIGIPVVSGNVSFYNESDITRVYPTPTIGMVGFCELKAHIKSNFNKDSTIVLIGRKIDENDNIGGSLYQQTCYDFVGGKIDSVDSKLELKLKELIFELRNKKLIEACIDVSSGGIFRAIVKGISRNNCGFIGNTGDIVAQAKQTEQNKYIQRAILGEVNGRYLLAVKSENINSIISICSSLGIECSVVGQCSDDNSLIIDGIKLDRDRIMNSYKNSIREYFIN